MTDAAVAQVVQRTLFDILEQYDIDGVFQQVDNTYVRHNGNVYKMVTCWIMEPEHIQEIGLKMFAPIQDAIGDDYEVKVAKAVIPVSHEYYTEKHAFKIQLFVYHKA